MKGFTFFIYKKGKMYDVFIETSRTRKTQALADKILHKLLEYFDIPNNPTTRAEILQNLRKAEYEEKQLENGKKIYGIYGDDFGTSGLVDDTIIVIHI